MSKSNFKAIPTTYSGINFRSRLEAKWAAFFHLMGWEYEYEPVDLNGYIPDFVLTGCKIPIYVEVKPALNKSELEEMCEKARRATLGKKLLCLGATVGYKDTPIEHGMQIGYLVSRINLCDKGMLDLYSSWYGAEGPEEWDSDDPSAQQCILGYYEESELRKCGNIICERLAPISNGYRKLCPFCNEPFPDRWEWSDHKSDFTMMHEVWKEAGNIIQYRYSKTS